MSGWEIGTYGLRPTLAPRFLCRIRSMRQLLPALLFLVLGPGAAVAGETAALPAAPEVKAAELAAPAEKPLDASAAKFLPVVEAYQQAHDSLLAWLRKASATMDAVDAKIADLKAKAEPRSAKETEQRLNAMRKREPAPPPDPELQALLTELQAQEARKKELSQALAAAVGQKVQESNKAVLEALDKAAAPVPAPAP